MKFVLAGYGSRGDVEPCVAVGRELVRRGHDVRMAAPPDMLGFVESAGLTAVAYGPDSQKNLNTAADFMRGVTDPISALPRFAQRVIEVWMDKTTTLASLTDGADLLLAGMNEQRSPPTSPSIAGFRWLRCTSSPRECCHPGCCPRA